MTDFNTGPDGREHSGSCRIFYAEQRCTCRSADYLRGIDAPDDTILSYRRVDGRWLLVDNREAALEYLRREGQKMREAYPVEEPT